MRVAIRADASPVIGFGHVTRCAALGASLRERGARVVFVGRDQPGDRSEWLELQGFQVLRLGHRDAPTPEQEIEDAQKAVTQLGSIDWLIVDHYQLDTRWERALKAHVRRLMVIDDFPDRHHDCDLLLNHNPLADAETAEKGDHVGRQCARLLGPNFALLNSTFAAERARCAPRRGPVRRAVIGFGGADCGGITLAAVQAYLNATRSAIPVDVVIGGGSPQRAGLDAIAAAHANVSVHVDTPHMASLLGNADLAIGAAGVSALERCCLGVPSLIITVAENQRAAAAELDRRQLAHWIGNREDVDTEQIECAVTRAMNTEWREQASRACFDLVDGQGAARVATILHKAI